MTCRRLFDSENLPNSVFFNDVVHILIPSAGKVDQNGTLTHLFRQLDGICHRMGAFNGGDDSLQAGQSEKRVDGFLIAYNVIFDPSQIVQERVLRTGGKVPSYP